MHTWDPAGTTTDAVGAVNFGLSGNQSVRGLAYNPASDIFYAVTLGGSLLSITPLGVGSILATDTVLSNIEGLAYDFQMSRPLRCHRGGNRHSLPHCD